MNRCTLFRKHKLGLIQKDGYQYCSRCGIAILPSCNHNWELIASIEKKYDWSYHMTYGHKENSLIRVYECSICKEIKKVML